MGYNTDPIIRVRVEPGNFRKMGIFGYFCFFVAIPKMTSIFGYSLCIMEILNGDKTDYERLNISNNI